MTFYVVALVILAASSPPRASTLVAQGPDSLSSTCRQNPAYCRLLTVGDEAGTMPRPPAPRPPPPTPTTEPVPVPHTVPNPPRPIPPELRPLPLLPARDSRSPEAEAARKDKPKEPVKKEPSAGPQRPSSTLPDLTGHPSGKRPCLYIGAGGPGLFRPDKRVDKVRCNYDCGGIKVTDFRMGNSDEVCKKDVPTW
jgi:hypothetical protein